MSCQSRRTARCPASVKKEALAVIAKALGIEHQSAAAVRAIALQEVRLQREFAKMVSEARA